MAYEFKLPDIGEGVVEGEIVEWLVKEGDTVVEDQPLVSVMTDKATVEIPSPKAGRVSRLGAEPGQIVKVGAVLVALETAGGDASAEKAPEPSAPKAAAPAQGSAPRSGPSAPPAKPASAPASAPAKTAASAPRAATASSSAARSAGPAQSDQQATRAQMVNEEESRDGGGGSSRSGAPAPRRDAEPSSDRVLASPATRKLARELDVDLFEVAGSGPRGRITREDVESAASAPKARPAAAREPSRESAAPAARERAPAQAKAKAPKELLAIPRRDGGAGEREEERVPLRGLRKKIAERMIESKRNAAHFAYVDELDVTELVEMRARLKPMAEQYGVSLTYMPFIMKALVPCLREFPLLNSTLDDQAGEIVLKRYYNIGVATDTERGLTVPVVKDVDRKSVLEIAAEITELSERARSGRSKLEDLQEGTFTVTSTGNIGGLFATPIINYPEVAILGVPKIKKRPWVVDGELAIRDVLYLALSLDHRVVDGAVGARFMNRLIEYLSEPSRLFLELA